MSTYGGRNGNGSLACFVLALLPSEVYRAGYQLPREKGGVMTQTGEITTVIFLSRTGAVEHSILNRCLRGTDASERTRTTLIANDGVI